MLLSREITLEQIVTVFFLFMTTYVCPLAWKYSAPTQWIFVTFCTCGLIISVEII